MLHAKYNSYMPSQLAQIMPVQRNMQTSESKDCSRKRYTGTSLHKDYVIRAKDSARKPQEKDFKIEIVFARNVMIYRSDTGRPP